MFYNNELNGKVFTLDEILSLLNQNKIPKKIQMDTQYYKYDFYIEAQVWETDQLYDYCKVK